jgi:hypothetical protein
MGGLKTWIYLASASVTLAIIAFVVLRTAGVGAS